MSMNVITGKLNLKVSIYWPVTTPSPRVMMMPDDDETWKYVRSYYSLGAKVIIEEAE
jgi:hypothetical protein